MTDKLSTSGEERTRVIDVFDDSHGTYHVIFFITLQEFLGRCTYFFRYPSEQPGDEEDDENSGSALARILDAMEH